MANDVLSAILALRAKLLPVIDAASGEVCARTKGGESEALEITNQGVKKFTRLENSTTVIDESKIEYDLGWDRLHGVIANIREEDASLLLARYARL